MFLYGGESADPLVVGEGLVVGRYQAVDILDPQVPQNFETKMAVEEEETSRLTGLRATTGGSTNPTSRTEAAICLNFLLVLTSVGKGRIGRMEATGNLMTSPRS